ncbi:MaoC domain-containing protein dehydratase [Natrialba chahannaoensis JCM 10990]|uniref:MaoC domain-containing protein dehydratase n=2 Tax=Natrialba chahannaoensis TaxID=68911 RepID=M0AMP1_9EURY|nr:MaoC domain-containing protein dehydratase [Natrialba chahannaoensis JCM 10990]
MTPPAEAGYSDKNNSSSSSDEAGVKSDSIYRTTTDGAETTDSVSAPIPSVDYSISDWEFERTVDDPAHISVGDVVTFRKTLSEDDVQAFARISGDTNRLHLDDEFAAETRFSERVVHGTLVSGLISAALARLPGLTIYLSQDLEFCGPVGIGDSVSARVEIVESLGNNRYRLETNIRNNDADEIVIQGEAVVMIDTPPTDN